MTNMVVEFTDVELCALLWTLKGYSAKQISKELVVAPRLVTAALDSARHKMRNVYAQHGKFVFPR